MGEFNKMSMFASPLMDAEAVQRDSIHRTCYELTREAIVNWLTEVVPEPPVTAESDDEGGNEVPPK
jgi:hypothetical protein